MWAHHGFCFFPFGILLIIFIIGGIAFRFRMARRFGGCYRGWEHQQHDDAEAIVRRRLANGEIEEEEYQKLMGMLKR